MVNTAKLTERLCIEVDTNLSGATSYGEYIPNWKTLKTIYASITTQKGAIKFDVDSGSQDYQDTISFFVYYQREIQDKKAFRIRYKGLIYTINNITTVQPNQATILDCVAVLS